MTCKDCIHYKSIDAPCDKYIYPEERNNEPCEHYVINDGSYHNGHWHCHRCGKVVDVAGLCYECEKWLMDNPIDDSWESVSK